MGIRMKTDGASRARKESTAADAVEINEIERERITMVKHIPFKLIVVALMFFPGCGSGDDTMVKNGLEPSRGVINAEIKYIWSPDAHASTSASMRTGVHNGEIYYVKDKGEDYAISFHAADGTLRHEFAIEKGRGPGQAGFPLGVKILDDTVYFADIALMRLSKFTLDGRFIDSFDWNSETGFIATFDLAENDLIFFGLTALKLGMMDMETGEIQKAVAYDPPKPAPGHDDPFEGGVLAYDKETGRIFCGMIDSPYRIDVYDMALNRIMTIYKKSPDVRKSVKWYVGGGIFDIIGDFNIFSMIIDDKYIYAPEISIRTRIINGGRENEPFDMRINVFDKNSGEYVYAIENKSLNGIRDELTLVGFCGGDIVLQVYGLKSSGENEAVRQFVVIENPLK